MLATFPAYVVITAWPSAAILIVVHSVLGLLNAVYVGPLLSALAELFPACARATSVALAFSITAMIGALSPAFAAWLIASTGDARSPAFIVIAAAVLSILVVHRYKDKHEEALL
ncbi:hypothetical protein [Bradyrhizobium symbiodeficiens]|uniref:hypothetical protein n=1 Tax=Bradyrhizobium symbiodeficiens TaxID=1404367 RepID=UPI0039C8762F